MDIVGVDLHKRESRLAIKAPDGTITDRCIVTTRERLTAVFRRSAARAHATRGEQGERVGGAPPRVAWPRGDRGRSELRADVRHPLAAYQDGQARCAGAHGRVRDRAYRPAHRLADGRRHVRAELAVRDVLVSTRTRCASLAKTFVRRDGLRVPASDSRLVPTKITALALSPALADKLAPLFAVCGPLNEQILGGNSLDSPRTTTKPWDSWRRPLLRTTQLRRGPATRHQLPVNRAAIAAAW
jgi:transposase